MKIFVSSPTFYPATFYGGPIFSTYNLFLAIAGMGNEVYVSTSDRNGDAYLDLEKNKFIEINKNLFVKYYGSSSHRGFALKMLWGLLEDMKSSDIAYIISLFSPSSLYAFFIGLIIRKKIIISPRGQLYEFSLQKNKILKRLWLWLFVKPFQKRINWHITSINEKVELEKIFNKSNSFLVPNSISITKLHSNHLLKDKTYYNKFIPKDLTNKKIVVSLGRYHYKKGFDVLIDALTMISEKQNNLVLIIAGSDHGYKEFLSNKISQLNLTEKVFLLDEINEREKELFLINADLFVLPSSSESFGIVYLEAMSYGLPVIASKNTPWEEIEKVGCGKWIDDKPELVAKAIEGIFSSDHVEMGKKGKEYALKNFSDNQVAKKFLKEIKALL